MRDPYSPRPAPSRGVQSEHRTTPTRGYPEPAPVRHLWERLSETPDGVACRWCDLQSTRAELALGAAAELPLCLGGDER